MTKLTEHDLDIFTSMGVLLHVQSMDQSSRELLGIEIDLDAMEYGMEFLRAASKTSTLAAKYVSMLELVQDAVKQGNRPENRNPLIAGVNALPQGNRQAEDAQLGLGSSVQMPSQMLEMQDAPDFENLNFDDWLFGLGLPANFSSEQECNGLLL